MLFFDGLVYVVFFVDIVFPIELFQKLDRDLWPSRL